MDQSLGVLTPSLFIGESHFKQGGVSPFQKMLVKCVTHDPATNSQEQSAEPQVAPSRAGPTL